MSIDIVTQSASLKVLQDFLVKRKLGKIVDGEFVLSKGITLGPWAGSGDFPTKAATSDDEGNQLTAPVYAAGFVAIIRVRDDFRIKITKTIDGEQVEVSQGDKLKTDPEADNREQHTRSRIARYLKNNGTKGKSGGINFRKLDGVKFYRYEDVKAFVVSRGLPMFVRGGGNKP